MVRDGRRIVFAMGSSIWRVNGDGRRLTRISRRNIVDPESPRLVTGWNADGFRGTNVRTELRPFAPSWQPLGRRTG